MTEPDVVDMVGRNLATMVEGKRLLLPGFISPELCQELVFIHKSCGVVGYRPHVFSTTLSHLVATNSAALVMPFLALREKLKEAVEEFFGCEFELFVEFTGLISWTKGANIGWHSDDNRDYLQQRHFSVCPNSRTFTEQQSNSDGARGRCTNRYSAGLILCKAVCYLNTYEQDFRGGLFHFQEGELATVIPTLGTVLIYSANEDNVHSVDKVTDGDRITMAMWFTRDAAHDEDKKIIDQLIPVTSLIHEKQDKLRESPAKDVCGVNTGVASQPSQVSRDAPLRDYIVPLPASDLMYWVSISKTESKSGHDDGCESCAPVENTLLEVDQGFDVRVNRLASLGFQCVFQQDDQDNKFEVPVTLKYKQQDIDYKFANVLHALQVVQFHEWRSACMTATSSDFLPYTTTQIVQDFQDNEFQDSKRPRTLHWAPNCLGSLRLVYHKDLEETMIKPWEKYTSALLTNLMQMMTEWRSTGSLYSKEMRKEG